MREGDRQVVAGAVAGLVGGAAMLVVGAAIRALRGEATWPRFQVAAAAFYGEAVALTPDAATEVRIVGLLLHAAVSALWGVGFALVAYGFDRRATLIAGACWGIVVWVMMYYVAFPLVGAEELVRGTPDWLEIAEHLTFGLGTAAAFLPSQRPFPKRRWKMGAHGPVEV